MDATRSQPLDDAPSSPVLADRVREIRFCGRWGSTRGLMFTRPRDRALVFTFARPSRIALHMCCVFYPIDVLFLDADSVIVDRKASFRPFTIYRSKRPAVRVIELPVGRIEGWDIGMRIELGRSGSA